MNRKIRVVWITQFSNKKVRDKMTFNNTMLEGIKRFLLHSPKGEFADFAQWISNGINEYEKINDVELHIVAPHPNISGVQEFEIDGIYYHFFRSRSDSTLFKKMFCKPLLFSDYRKNRIVIKKIVDKIGPDIVHVIGAENPQYSLAALDVNTSRIPLIVSLQTLMSVDGFRENYSISDEEYNYRSKCEQDVLHHTEFVGTKVIRFKKTIWNCINPNAIFLNTSLFVGENIDRSEVEKKYDIIYFANDIAKAADIALKTLNVIIRQRSQVNMCVVGGCNITFKSFFEHMIQDLGLSDNIIILGKLPTHDDVLRVIKEARVALLPVKVDGITGTMREAMANGVPLVTTETWGTPLLNINRKTAFVEKIDDYESMACDVIALLENKDLYKELRENGFATVAERYSNEALAKIQNEIYRAVLDYKNNNKPIPDGLCDTNTSIHKI